jgi:hypothetical protein
MAMQLKWIETRGWATDYRGPVAIHAAKKDDLELRIWWETRIGADPETEFEPRRRRLASFRAAGIPGYDELPRGMIVAVGLLLECRPTEEVIHSGLVSLEEAVWGNYAPGRYGWIFSRMVMLSEPIPFRGALGLFDWPAPAEIECLHLCN